MKMKTRALVLFFVLLFSTISMRVCQNLFNGRYWIHSIIIGLILIALAARWVNKKEAELKTERDIEKLAIKFLPEYKEYYYSKVVSMCIMISYIFMSLGFTYAAIIAGESTCFLVAISIAAALCYWVLYYTIVKWLLPAYRKQPAFSIDEQALDLKNSYTPIRWNEIETIIQRGSIICIKLSNLDSFIERQPIKKNPWYVKLTRKVNGYHFGISLVIIRNDNTIISETIEDYFTNGKENFKI